MKLIDDFLWWEWYAGSSLFFCKWPQQYQAWAREVQPHYAIDNFPPIFAPLGSSQNRGGLGQYEEQGVQGYKKVVH